MRELPSFHRGVIRMFCVVGQIAVPVKSGGGELEQEKRAVYYYSPTVSREEYGSGEARRLAEKVYGGGLTKLVASFVEDGEFSASELDELRAILEQAREGSS